MRVYKIKTKIIFCYLDSHFLKNENKKNLPKETMLPY